jgi:feruloyl esterase
MKNKNRRLLVLVLFVAGTSALASAAGRDCASMMSAQAAGVTIQKAEQMPALPVGSSINAGMAPIKLEVALPSYCRLDGIVDPRKGVNGVAYGIGFALALPDNWNGRFYLQGGGGLNGSVGMPLGAQAAGNDPALARGYAVVAMDSGHQGRGPFDAGFLADQKAALDFYYLAVGRITVVAKDLVAQYYGKPAEHSYFSGCSTGGREGMVLTQRYPEYFDGVIVGDPAMRADYSNLALAYIGDVFGQAAPQDAAGKPDPAKLFSDADKKLIRSSLLDACDAKDGLKDGMIFNPLACDYDPAVLTCKGGKTATCLTAPQVKALKTALAGPKDAFGNDIYVPFPYDVGIADTGGFLPGLLAGPRIPVAAPGGGGKFDAARLAAQMDRNAGLEDSLWTNLTTFAAHRKVIYYHGASDPWFSPLDTFTYYKKMAADTGGEEKARAWSRFYFVPGMGHCSGGTATLDSFDMLGAITDWVEKGIAPEGVMATGRSLPGRSRPLCPYPTHTQYKGQGDPQDASNFTCTR